MLREVQQVLRLIMCLRKQKQHDPKTAGELLVLLWNDTRGSAQSLNCTIAAAGLWCAGIKTEELQPDLEESLGHCAWSCPQPDPEELSAFTRLYGSLRLLLSFQMKGSTVFGPECCTYIEAFLHKFSLTNARIKIHLTFKLSQTTFQREFSGKIPRKIASAGRPPPVLDVTCFTQPPLCVKRGFWCLGSHPVCGGQIPLSIPPGAMDQGLFGELSVQPVTLLNPCVLQYPYLPTRLTHIQVLVYSPSNVPVIGPSIFFQRLPAHLDCQVLGLLSLHCTSSEELVHHGGSLYTVQEENCEGPDQEPNQPGVQQGLLLLLFLQHSDPFSSHLSDVMVTEALIEHHLEDVLNHNRKVVTSALQTELKNALKAQKRKQKQQEKLHSAAEVILSSCITIVSCSSNVGFRNACLNCMKVNNTHDLSASLRESLRRVTLWKFVSKGGCYSGPTEEHLEGDEPTRTEM
ncbi:type 2 DNA topoisomerase 6 subunit B-like [Halichoeres trimaculatus]|uniref:type 2 DNA topoisomerase 6 subunit B-like n=1 Tax=Halichoeres trimaculatus TaxID=147232 RepID=UPI003D9EEDB3